MINAFLLNRRAVLFVFFLVGVFLILLLLKKDSYAFKINSKSSQVNPVNDSSDGAYCTQTNSFTFLLRGKDGPFPKDSGSQSASCGIRSLEKLGGGSQPDWSWDGKYISFTDKVGDSYEIFIMKADGSEKRCLTCDVKKPKDFIGKHKGKPTFYPPDSNYLLFSVENENGDHSFRTIPGVGDNHDLWITDTNTGKFWRLTENQKDSAIQYPRFSSDGSKLLWSLRYEKDRGNSIRQSGCEYGFWKLEMADVSVNSSNVELTNVSGSEPIGRGYYEPHGFYPGDNTKIIMTARTSRLTLGKSAFYLDIVTYNLGTKQHLVLASTDYIHYEMATYSPGGGKIAYMAGPFIGITRGPHKTDLYIADSDGSNQQRVTFFNQRGHAEYENGTVQIQKLAWSPKGNQLVSAFYNHKTKDSTLFKIDFIGECGLSE